MMWCEHVLLLFSSTSEVYLFPSAQKIHLSDLYAILRKTNFYQDVSFSF